MTDKDKMRFEQWYVENAFDYLNNPIGSRDCGLQRTAYYAACAHKDAEHAAEQEQLAAAQLTVAMMRGDFKKILDEPNDSMSDAKCVRYMVQYAKKGIARTSATEPTLTKWLAERAAKVMVNCANEILETVSHGDSDNHDFEAGKEAVAKNLLLQASELFKSAEENKK